MVKDFDLFSTTTPLFLNYDVTKEFYYECRSIQCYLADQSANWGYCFHGTTTNLRCAARDLDPVPFGAPIVTRQDYCVVCIWNEFIFFKKIYL